MWLNRLGVTGVNNSIMYFVELDPTDPGGASMGSCAVGFVGSTYPGAASNDGRYIGQDSNSIGFLAGATHGALEGILRWSNGTLYQSTDIWWSGSAYLGLGVVFEATNRTHIYFYLYGVEKYDLYLEDYMVGPYKIAASLDLTSPLDVNIKLIPSNWNYPPTILPNGITNVSPINGLTTFLDENSGTVTGSGTEIFKGTVGSATPFVTNTIIAQ